jgi:F-type H+-transporting ATPase subunit delta
MEEILRSGVVISLPGRYAKVLFELAHEAKAADKIAEELDQVLQVIDQAPELATALRNPTLTREEQAGILKKLGEKLAQSPLLTSFLVTLCHNRRYRLLKAITQVYHQLIDAYHERQPVTVEHAHPLTANQIQEIAKKLEDLIGKNLKITYQQHASLLGGVRIRHRHRVIDLSLATQLSNLASLMKGAA